MHVTLVAFVLASCLSSGVDDSYSCDNLQEQSMSDMITSRTAEMKRQIEQEDHYRTQEAIENNRLILMPDGKYY